MQQIALAKWAHDIRNTLGTVALYVDTLDRQAGSRSDDVAACTHTLLAKAAAMCEAVVRQARHGEHEARRSSLDITTIVEQIRDLITPTLPTSASLQIAMAGPILVMMDAQDAFRILFNLVHNAAAVARRSANLHRIRIAGERTGTTAVVTVADDGPGLPEAVRSNLFRPGPSTPHGSGYGLAIARELAERNGGAVTLAKVARGTAFVIELPLAAAQRVAV
jgi:two-component system sensor histidine kinase PilS (NtrC family)